VVMDCDQKQLQRECAAEFCGTVVMIMFGQGVVAQTLLSDDHGDHGEYLSINIAWGLGVLFGILMSGGVSGAHLNPAVTLSLATHRRFPWRKVLPFMFSQIAGAFFASAVVFAVYLDALREFDGGERAISGEFGTAAIFCTFPQPFLSVIGGFIDQVVGTALLMAGIFAIGDERNKTIDEGSKPFAVALLVVAIGTAFGFNCGYAINPARDFGPRLFISIAGWGEAAWSDGTGNVGGWWWVPIVGPAVGGLVGSYFYQMLVGLHHPDETDTNSSQVLKKQTDGRDEGNSRKDEYDLLRDHE